jgi:capsular exopolysaccharide synthesis family protein
MQEHKTGTILWRGKWIIAIALVVTIALAVVATTLASKTYEATAIFQIGSPNAQLGEATDLANQGLAKNYATVIVSDSFLERIRDDVTGGELQAAELKARLKAAAIEETGLMRLEATGPSPREAQRLASQISEAFLTTLQRDATQRSRRQQDEVQEVIDELTAQIEELSVGTGATENAGQISSLIGARSALRRQSANLVADGVAQGASATLTAAPTASSDPVSPRPLLNLVAAALLGLLLGVGLVLLRERLSPALHTAEDAAEAVDLPVLASVPLRRRLGSGDPVLNEAYEMLRASVDFRTVDEDIRVLTLGSYNAGEGKSSVVEGLGYAVMRGTSNVVLVDGDLRAGTLSKRLAPAGGPDLSSVMIGGSLDDALVPIGPGLSLLPVHGAVPSPPSLLYSNAMRDTIAELRERFDLVLIDSPPLAHLADASILASLSDGFIFVARTGSTKATDLRAGAAAIRRTDTPLLGLVVFEPRPIDKNYYPAVTGLVPSEHDPAGVR